MTLENILSAQQDELELERGMIEREVEKNVKRYLNKNIIKVITGLRRVGKTVLAKRLLKDKDVCYVNFDDERLVNHTLEDIFNAAKNVYGDSSYVFFDEIQNMDGWELFVNRLQREGYNIVITGSNANLLSRELSTHLTGRYVEVKLWPFSYKEWMKAKKEKASLDSAKSYLFEGGMPEVVVKEYDSNYLKMLVENIVTKDVAIRYGIKDVLKIKNLVYYVFSNISCPLSFRKISSFLGISPHTVSEYLSFLEEAYLVMRSRFFSFKVKEQIGFPMKYYCVDNGIARANGFVIGENIGHLMENLVAIELLRRGEDLFYYKDERQREIDFVSKTSSIQVSYTESERETRVFTNKIGEENILITWDDEGYVKKKWFGKEIEYKKVPLYKWLSGDGVQ